VEVSNPLLQLEAPKQARNEDSPTPEIAVGLRFRAVIFVAQSALHTHALSFNSPPLISYCYCKCQIGLPKPLLFQLLLTPIFKPSAVVIIVVVSKQSKWYKEQRLVLHAQALVPDALLLLAVFMNSATLSSTNTLPATMTLDV
jgi:hypothetical protein